MARPDLLRAVQGLARHVTKWSTRNDIELHRLVSHIHCTRDYLLTGWIGDQLVDIDPHLFSDADFAGCGDSLKSTSGAFLVLRGQNSSFPISASSKRQGCISHSTTEAEVAAADAALRSLGLPILTIWEQIAGRPVRLFFHEDNKAVLDIMKSGRNPTMRYVSRTQGVSMKWLHEVYQRENIHSSYVPTSLMAADIFTKPYTDGIKWTNLCEQINVMPCDRFGASDLHETRGMFSIRNDERNRSHAVTVSRTPPGEDDLPTKPGWHRMSDGRLVVIVNEPKSYRVPALSDQRTFPIRTTWLLRRGNWTRPNTWSGGEAWIHQRKTSAHGVSE